MYPPPPQHDLPPVGHLLPSRQLWELELYDQLQCMPDDLAMHIAESFVWWIRGTKRAWLWWALRTPALTRYLDGLLDMLEEFRPQSMVAWPSSPDEEFALLYLADCWVRVELTAAEALGGCNKPAERFIGKTLHAQLRLGALLHDGDRHRAPDPAAAVALYRTAALAGSASAQFLLGFSASATAGK
ncbi:unnamed protein product [Symbiodinium microadriaticum]|nr:unnamed protein product [Symbiodinium microadriaticum]